MQNSLYVRQVAGDVVANTPQELFGVHGWAMDAGAVAALPGRRQVGTVVVSMAIGDRAQPPGEARLVGRREELARSAVEARERP